MGNFDGVHLGHQRVIARTVELARRRGAIASAVTFDPHPEAVVSAAGAPPLLTDMDRRIELMGSLGLDLLVVQPFTPAFAANTPEAFVRMLAEALAVRTICVGTDFRFGGGRRGDWRVLRSLAAERGAALVRVRPVEVDGVRVSSSAIRAAISRGDVELAARMLGRPHEVCGTAVKGEGRGRSLGYPTVNLDVSGLCLPADGVYAGTAHVGGEEYIALISYGRPESFGGGAKRLEAHLLGFSGDLYGRTVRLRFAARLRDQRRFPSADALAEQIRRDEEQARRLLAC